MQETSDNVSSVATPRTRVPGKTSKVPPNLAPLDAVLPEDMRLAHTSTTLELMQAHASTNETKKGDTRRQRDVQRWRDEAGEVRDALLLRDEAERSAKMRLVNEMGAVAVGGTDDDGTCDGTSATSTDKPPSRAFGDERAPSRSHSVEWVQAYRPEQGAASATAKAREARKAALALARAAAKKKAEEKAARKAADPRSSFWKALDLTKRALGLESAYDAMRAGEAARREAAEAEEAAARSAARRDAALDANVLLRDELHGSVSPEREDALRARFRERVAEAGEVLAEDSRDDSRDDSRRAPSPFLCVIERGCAEIRVALNRDDFDDESDVGGDDGRTDSDIDRDADTRRPRRDGTRARLGFGPSRLVATLSRGHAFAVDGAALASLFGCSARATFAVVVRDPEDPEASADGACVLWELRDRAAFAAMAPSLLRRRAAFATLWANVPALGAFSDPARAFFMDAARRVTRRPGAHFCVERAPCDALGVVETGRAIAHREAPEDGTEADAARSTQKCDAARDAASDTPPEDTDATPEPGRVSGASRGSVSRRVILGEYARGDFFGARALLRDDAGARGTPASQSTNDATTTARDVTSVLVVTRTAFRRLTRGAPGGFGSERNAISETERGTRTDPKTYDGRNPLEDFGDAFETVVAEDAFAFAEGISGPAARAEESAWRLTANRAPLENSAAARLLLDALLRTPPFVAVGRSVTANAEALARRARPRRVRVGDTLFRRGDACVAAFIVQTGVVRLVGDDHGGDLADEHVEIPEEDDADTRSRPRPFGDARAAVRDASSRRVVGVGKVDARMAVRGGSFSSSSGTTTTRNAPGADSGLRVVAELGPGDACGFAALPHPGCGAVWQCSAAAAASPSPAGWVTVWELGMKDFHQTVGYAVDDKRHRFAALLRPESCAALAGLTERQRLRAADALDEATYESGERIVARGAPSADGVFVVTRGVAQEETPFRASGADDISRAGRESSIRTSRGSDVSSARLLRRGDVFGTDGVFDGGTRERSVVAVGGVGARVSCAVWRPAALAQLGFLRRALEEFQRRA